MKLRATLTLIPTGRTTFSDKDFSPVFKFKQVNQVLIPLKEHLDKIGTNTALEHVKAVFVFDTGEEVEHTRVYIPSASATSVKPITMNDLNAILQAGSCMLSKAGDFYIYKPKE